ncbi:effector-associated domain EAD1-containing protein [Dactylosporangium sp. CA-152071]|uniref:effector-associated domain EAD1-containing protein n=1 Tax=Dactylosporangium sp. CA-152071 TaxID=3239933 RepID=UPI003D932255
MQRQLMAAMCDAYTKRSDLDQMVYFVMERNLPAIVGDQGLQDVIFEMIRAAAAEGWLDELIDAVIADRPGNRLVKQFTAAHRPAVPAVPAMAVIPVPAPPAAVPHVRPPEPARRTTRHLATRTAVGDGPQPPQREVEAAGAGPVAATDPPMVVVHREPYLMSPALAEVVNAAIAIGRPLLLQGEPGVGKTRLAHAVAYEFGLPLEQIPVDFGTRGRDLLYEFDAVRRLADAQTGHLAPPHAYVQFGPLGRTIVRAMHGRRSVLLIDEIDRSGPDFPSELLRVLENLRFEIAEAPGESYGVPADRPDLRPIVIITNNEERALPSGFLRRCVTHIVEPPDDPATLDQILVLHGIDDPDLRWHAIRVFLRLRAMNLERKPGLSELLDWVAYQQTVGARPANLPLLPSLGMLVKRRADQVAAARAFAFDDG